MLLIVVSRRLLLLLSVARLLLLSVESWWWLLLLLLLIRLPPLVRPIQWLHLNLRLWNRITLLLCGGVLIMFTNAHRLFRLEVTTDTYNRSDNRNSHNSE